MVGGTVMAYLGGIHFWWPKITGRMYPEGWARFAALMIFVGFNLTFFPQFVLGYLGMPRRYAVYPPEFQVLNVMSSAGASILGVGYLIPLIYLIWSHALRADGRTESLGRQGPGVGDAVAAAHGKFRGDPDGDRRSLRLRGTSRRRTSCLTHGRARPRASAGIHASIRGHGAAARRRHPGDVGVPGHRNHVLRRDVRAPTRSTARCTCRRFEAGSRLLNVKFGAANTAVLIGSSLTMALAVRAAQAGKKKSEQVMYLDSDHDPGRDFPGLEIQF